MARSTPLKVTVIPPTRSQRRSLPLWVQGLGILHGLTGVAAIAITLVTATIYVKTVQSQAEWNRLHSRLEQLQRDERHYVLTREELAHALREAASQSQLVPLSPERVLHVPAAPARPLNDVTPEDTPAGTQFPSGY